MKDVKRWIMLYFLLLLFEGGLRKWILPQLATPLLIIRDPVLVLIYHSAISKKVFPYSMWITILVPMAGLSIFMAFFFGHRNLYVAMYGARACFFHIPLIFVMARVYNQSDVDKIVKLTIKLVLPMTVLMVMQFYSPQSSFVNIGVGGEGSSGFSGAMGKFRPSTTFSFITGPVLFYTLSSACLLYAVASKKLMPQRWIYTSGACLGVAMPMSISRSLVLSVLIVLIGGYFGLYRTRRTRRFIPKILITVLVLFFIARNLPYTEDAVATFAQRWENASQEKDGGVEHTIGLRVLNWFSLPLEAIFTDSIIGQGIGMGTNVGAKLLTGEVNFLISEIEWLKLIGELGTIVGLCYVTYRIMLTIFIFRCSWMALGGGKILPWLLFLSNMMGVLMGNWGQPTTLGFSCFVAGLNLAACNMWGYDENPKSDTIRGTELWRPH